MRNAGGGIERESHTVYESHLGPILELPQLPWSKQWAYAIRDANLRNNRGAEQVLAFYQARSVEDVLAALRSTQGTAFVNTLAADRNGRVLYADFSVIPNLERDTLERCRALEIPGNPVHVLRGAPDCEWGSDARAQQPGILPPERLPQLLRDDYVTNSNDSHWALVVEAQGVLTYSQSEDPDSPHAVDQTRLYSEGKWIELPFTEAAIAADPDLETLELRSR